MGYDLIENSEMGALSTSRLGNKCFVDDDDFSNGTGGFLGIGRKKAVTRKITREKGQLWAIDKSKENDCNYLTERMEDLKNEISFELSKNPSKKQRERYVVPLLGSELEYKKAIAKNKCLEKKSEAEDQKFKKETEDAIQRASNSTPEIPKVNIAKGGKTTKIILISVGILVVGVIAIKLLKRN